MSGLRERNKAIRVEAILDAAVDLLGRDDLHEVTTEQIAAQAGVSPATVYNLVGTRDELLRAVVHRVVDDLVDAVARATASDDDPIAVAHLIVDHSVSAFTAHSRAYRQIVGAGRGADGAPGMNWVDPSQLQVAALRQAQEIGVLRADVDPEPLGRQVYISWMGAMGQWAQGVLDDHGFAVATRHGLVTVLAAAASEPHRSEFLGQLDDLGVDLAARWHA